MLKYVDIKITFAEVPDEITLCINISGCPCNCKGCHSSYLAKDIGTELYMDELYSIIKKNQGITCVAFMGGDVDPKYVNTLAGLVKIFSHYKLKVAWYSGRQELDKNIKLKFFDFIKLGPYEEDKGPLTSKTTNQRFYKVEKEGKEYNLIDITHKFQKHETES